MAQAKTKYVATDGTEFDTELEADTRNAEISEKGTIEAYCEHSGLAKAQKGLLRKHLAGFIAFRNAQNTPPAGGAEA
jgi:hypothetical protein